ncbi:MAG: hypothetical protein MUF54_19835, partial [Polyangiaceae bacterium]|nr:hypothetical protein [Polyangiaceae bacterium]
TATTRKADALTYLSTIADRLLERGQSAVAARMLSEHLKEVLEGVRMGEEVPPDVFASAVRCALKLADASWDPRWLDYVVEVHLAAHLPMAEHVCQQFAELWRRVPSIDIGLLRLYQQHLRERLAFAGSETVLFEAVLAMRAPDPEQGKS